MFHNISVYRVSQLKVAMVAWRAGTQISKAERAEDMRVAEVYWSRSALRAHFTAWRDSLLTNKACRMCDSNFTRFVKDVICQFVLRYFGCMKIYNCLEDVSAE
jgi:hypothetical protein